MENLGIDYSRQVNYGHAAALARLKEVLKENKWGVLSDIDVKATLKEKIGVEIESYNILDVCNPRIAERGLRINKKMGLVMPCKMAVYSDEGKTTVALYLPTRQLPRGIKGYEELKGLAEEAEPSLRNIVESI